MNDVKYIRLGSQCAPSRCATKIEMDSILATQQRGTARQANATNNGPSLRG